MAAPSFPEALPPGRRWRPGGGRRATGACDWCCPTTGWPTRWRPIAASCCCSTTATRSPRGRPPTTGSGSATPLTCSTHSTGTGTTRRSPGCWPRIRGGSGPTGSSSARTTSGTATAPRWWPSGGTGGSPATRRSSRASSSRSPAAPTGSTASGTVRVARRARPRRGGRSGARRTVAGRDVGRAPRPGGPVLLGRLLGGRRATGGRRAVARRRTARRRRGRRAVRHVHVGRRRGVARARPPSASARRPSRRGRGGASTRAPWGRWPPARPSTCSRPPTAASPPRSTRCRDECTLADGDAFFQGISHTGLGTYLTMQLAAVELRAGDRRSIDRLGWMLDAATPTWTWPEAIHPRVGGGCMGDGHHGWAAASVLSFVRDLLVRELPAAEGGEAATPTSCCRRSCPRTGTARDGRSTTRRRTTAASRTRCAGTETGWPCCGRSTRTPACPRCASWLPASTPRGRRPISAAKRCSDRSRPRPTAAAGTGGASPAPAPVAVAIEPPSPPPTEGPSRERPAGPRSRRPRRRRGPDGPGPAGRPRVHRRRARRRPSATARCPCSPSSA